MNNNPDKNRNSEFIVLNQLVAEQSVLHVFPDDVKLGEFIVQALVGMPGVKGCAICLRNGFCVRDMPEFDFTTIIETLKNIPDNQDFFSISLTKKENRHIYSIQTLERLFGYVFLSIKDSGSFEIFKPAINNFVNMVAMELENRWQKQQLVNHKLHLEKLVEKRTIELEEEINDRKQVESKLLKNQYYLTKAQEMGIIGTWELDIQKNILKWTDENYKIFGVPLGTEMNFELFMNCIHPDDKEYVNKKWNAGLNKEPYDIEHRIIINDEVKWVREKADIEFDVEGNPVMAIGFAQDISERKQADKALNKSKQHYLTLFSESPVASWEEDFSEVKKFIDKLKNRKVKDFRKYFDDRPEKLVEVARMVKIVEVNNATLKLHEADSKKELLNGLAAVFTEDSYKAFKEEVIAIAEDRTEYKFDGVVKTLKGEERDVHLEWLVVPGYEKSMEKVLVSIVDITDRKRAEEKLKKSKVLLKETGRIAKLGGWELDAKTLEVTWTEETYHLHEIPLDTKPLLGEAINFFHPDDRPKLEAAIQKALENGDPYDMEIRFTTAKGKDLWIHTTCKPVVVDGKTVKLTGTFQDITDRKQTEMALKETEEKFRTLVTNSEEIVYIIDKDGTFLLSEGKGLSKLGLQPGQVVGQSVFELYKDFPDMLDEMRRAFDGETITNEAEVGDNYFRNWYTPHKNHAGKIIGLLGLSVNISEQKKMEEKVIEEKNKAQQYLNIAEVMLVSTDSSGIVKLINPKGCEILGYSEEEIVGHNWFDNFLPERLREIVKQVSKKVFAGEMESVDYYENEILTKSGDERLIAWHNAVYKDDAGKVIGTLSSGEDITERKKSEERIVRFSRIFEDSLNEIFLFKTDTFKIIQVNKAAQKNMGYTMEEFKKMTPIDFKPKFTTESFEKLVVPLLKGEKKKIIFETVHQRKDQSLYNTEVHLQLMEYEQERIFVAIILDITERKRAEIEIKMERDKLTAIFESMQDGVYIVNKDYDIQYVNPVLKKELGVPGGEKCHKYFHDSDEPCSFCKNEDVFAGKTVQWEWTSPVNGKTYDLIDTPIKNADGSISKLEIFRDITERKLTEEELAKHREHLEELIKVRTKELEEKNKKLERFNKLFVDREFRIKELRDKVKELEKNERTN